MFVMRMPQGQQDRKVIQGSGWHGCSVPGDYCNLPAGASRYRCARCMHCTVSHTSLNNRQRCFVWKMAACHPAQTKCAGKRPGTLAGAFGQRCCSKLAALKNIVIIFLAGPMQSDVCRLQRECKDDRLEARKIDTDR